MATKSDDTVTLSRADLDTMIKSAVEAGKTALPPQRSENPDTSFAEDVARVRGTANPKRLVRHIPCVSLETGATFTARVQESAAHPLGRIIALNSYAYPTGFDRHVKEGGLVPDGLQMRTSQGGLVPPYKQWLYEQFYKVDLNRYAGKAYTRALSAVETDPVWAPDEAAA